MRRAAIAANWKMHKTRAEAVSFAEQLIPQLKRQEDLDVIVAAPFTALGALAPALEGSPVGLAAQNVHPEPGGAFTGEVSVEMLRDLGCHFCLVGHSERRTLFGETGAFVAEKVRALQAASITPIVCVGETLPERESDRTFDVVAGQLAESLAGADPELILAYEPVWAIGTGRTATPGLAQQVHAFCRERLVERFGGAGDAVRIQYGGSVTPENAAALLAEPDIDGALVGGASLDPDSFCAIIRACPSPNERDR